MPSHNATSPHLSPLSIFVLPTNTAFPSNPDVATLELQLCPCETVLSVFVSTSSIPGTSTSTSMSIIKWCRKSLALCQRRGTRVLLHWWQIHGLRLLLCVGEWRILCLSRLRLEALLLLLYRRWCCVELALERLLGDEIVWLLRFLSCWLFVWVLRVIWEGHLSLMSSLLQG